MSIKKLSFMLLSALSLAALLNGCGSDSKAGNSLPSDVARVDQKLCIGCHSSWLDPIDGTAIVPDYLASQHSASGVGCQDCHGGGAQHNGVGPLPFPNPSSAGRCNLCHNSHPASGHDGNSATSLTSPGFVNNCISCHNPHNPALFYTANCLACHTIAQAQVEPGLVNDNSGVRAIGVEFTKRSHHITGATPTNAQCVVCHLEGKVFNGIVVVDSTKHMVDNMIHLRNADDNSDIVWSGTEHTNMDNFCFSCHDIDGAKMIGAPLNTFAGVAGFTGTPSNPFGDTLTNGYDQVTRAGVVDVKTPFTVTNASHHAVSGQRYQYRFSTLANAQAWAARTGNPVPAASEIAEGHTTTIYTSNVTSPFGTGLTYDPAGPEEGGEATLYEAGKFVSTYIPLGDTKNVADNSTLHCGDCHTVGQWKSSGPGLSTNADGSTTSVAIGAHGSNNEYLLRNSLGTDELHNGRTYVCFNCHSASAPLPTSGPNQNVQESNTLALWNKLVAEGHINASTAVTTPYTNTNGLNPVVVPQNIPVTLVPSWKAGWNALHPTIIVGGIHGYATAHAVSAMHIQCEADSAEAITSVPNRGFNNFSSNRLQRSWSPQAAKAYDYLPAPGATATAPLGGSNAGSGNITGISCTNCHNSGLRGGFGGIHGGNGTYVDGLGRTQTTYRFMPGMGNYRYAPPGGWDGKDVSDATLLTATNPLQNNGPANGSGSLGFPGTSGKPIGGCYTNGGTTGAGDLNNSGGVTYGVCNHHGTSTAAPSGVTTGYGTPKTTVTGNTATFRATYGGGTTGSPTTYEPTVREATAGGTLVTRPLKY